MIKLSKLEEPPYLAERAEAWTNALRAKRIAGETPTDAELNRYNHPAIKLALIAETSGKCAYCESKILHITYGDIEHIVPKSSGDENRFSWNNLTLACDICNTKKSDKDNIVDPYVDDPYEIFSFIGPIIFPNSNVSEDIGYRTYVILDLNRNALRERRFERIDYLEKLLQIYWKTTDPDVAEVLRDDILNKELDASTEFASAARWFLKARAPDLFEVN